MSMRLARATLDALCVAAAVGWFACWTAPVSAQQATNFCGALTGTGVYGPFDYRKERDGKLKVVEEHHFTPEIEALIRGKTGSVASELSYTLGTSPNHHRALIAVVRLGDKMKSPQPPGLRYSIPCYFDRALRYQPDDIVVRVLHAQYLAKQGQRDRAVQQLQTAESYAKDDAFAQYNIGLMYYELKDYEQALEHAHRAKKMGFDRPELAEMLKRVNKWQEPTE